MEVSTMNGTKEEHDEHRPLVKQAADVALFPVRVATSPPLLRTYLRTLLLFIASAILFAFAVIAYTSFYYSYIPIRGITVPVYLQFDHGSTPRTFIDDSGRKFGQEVQKWPHGVVGIQGLVDRQKYDVSVEMVVPRSRRNLEAGNWMVELSLRGPSTPGGIKSILGWDDDTTDSTSQASTAATTSRPPVLAHSRRPAILTYRSWPIEHVHRFLRLPLYLTGFGSESETLHISMLESAYFPTTIPTSLRLELRSKTPLEIYRASVHITAKLEGLRWLMYTHRLTSLTIFVALFWATEMTLVLLTWGLASMLFASPTPPPDTQTIKHEPDDAASTQYSDTDRTFPTLSRQPPLRYHSPPHVKKEEDEDVKKEEDDEEGGEEEADDEEDDFVLEEPLPRGVENAVLFTDSGLGTGVDSEVERERERVRRRGRKGE